MVSGLNLVAQGERRIEVAAREFLVNSMKIIVTKAESKVITAGRALRSGWTRQPPL